MQKQSLRSVLPKEGVLEMCCEFLGAYLCMGVILIKLQSDIVENALLRCCPPVGLFLLWGASSLENTSEGLLLKGDNLIYNFFSFF